MQLQEARNLSESSREEIHRFLGPVAWEAQGGVGAKEPVGRFTTQFLFEGSPVTVSSFIAVALYLNFLIHANTQ